MDYNNPATATSDAGVEVSGQSGTSGSGYRVGLEGQWQHSWQSVTMGTLEGVPTEGGTEAGTGIDIPRFSRARRIIRKFRMANQDGAV
jgi:hypothetical protein